MTHYPKFFLNRGRILALWVMYTICGGNTLLLLTKYALMKRYQKIGQSPLPPPPLIWTKSKRTAPFFVRASLRRNEGAPSK